MRYVLAFAVLFLLASLGVSALPYVSVLGVTPNLVLILVACWAVLRGPNETMVVAPMAGILRDLTASDPVGTSVLALSPIVLLASAAREFRMVQTDFLPALAVVAAGSLAYSLISMTVLAATGQEIVWVTALIYVALPSAIVNALFTVIVYLPLRWLSPGLTPSASRLGPVIPA